MNGGHPHGAAIRRIAGLDTSGRRLILLLRRSHRV